MRGEARMLSRLLAGLLAMGGFVVWACGPDFPMELLPNRQNTLVSRPTTYFQYEAQRLVVVPPENKLVTAWNDESTPYDSEDRLTSERVAAESIGLDAKQVAQLTEIRSADGGDAAYAAGGGLPEAVRIYTAAAVDFQLDPHCVVGRPRSVIYPGSGRESDESPDGELSAVSDSVNTDTSPQISSISEDIENATDDCDSKKAALTRFASVLALPAADRASRATWAAYMVGRTQRDLGHVEEAIAAFQMTRQLAQEGLPDPLNLGVASYGEEAGIYLLQDDAVKAAALYSEQASRGSNNAVASLKRVIERLTSDPEKLTYALQSPVIQRLAAAYFVTDYGNSFGLEYLSPPSASRPGNDSPLGVFLSAIKLLPEGGLVGADRMAAVAYGAGDFDLAMRLAARSEAPFALWVQAKLALQRGDLETAAQRYARLVDSFPAYSESEPDAGLDWRSAFRIQGERGVLALARGEYLAALEYLYTARDYWLDAAQVAERVLTVDELKQFVDQQVPAANLSTKSSESSDRDLVLSGSAVQLRDLLARRLMREGRFAEALPYFHPDNTEGFDPSVRMKARQYAKLVRQGDDAWTRIGRAEARYEAAKLARFSGLDIMGFELSPDGFYARGNFPFDDTYGEDEGRARDLALISADERARAAASVAKHDRRYHYRYVAVDLAMAAADLVPPRSQAFAAILCEAAGWGIDQDVQKALYRRYVEQGPYVPWAESFGSICDEPDFDAASAMVRQEQFRSAKRYIRRHPGTALAAVTAVVIVLGLAFVSIRRRRRLGP